MEYFNLSDDLRISRVLTGMWQIADLERDGKTLDPVEASSLMCPYIAKGFNSFDMADHYGSAEIIAGHLRSQEELKDKVQLLTKWVPTPRITSKSEVRKAVQRALDRLQMERLDLLQYHAWNYSDPEWLDTMFWLQELKEEGFIKNIGVTNFDAAHLGVACASGIEIVSNQISYSLLDQRASGDMIEICDKFNVSILAFGTLAGGFLSERWLNKEEPDQDALQTWSQMKYKRYIDTAGGWAHYQQLLKTVSAVAKRHNCSIANICSKYILDQPHVAGVILGARLGVSSHIEENLKLFQFTLSEDDRNHIRKAMSHMNVIPGGCGDEYRKPPFLTASGDLSHHINELPKVYTPKEFNNRLHIDSGTPWESMAGYSRAVRHGNSIHVSGTTATHGQRLIGGNDAAAQTHYIIDKIAASLESFGASLENVIRTRIFVNNQEDWKCVSRAHGRRFKEIRPANTLVQAGLIGEGYLVEIEADAVV